MTEVVVKKPAALSDETEGMSYLSTLPQRLVRVYLPLSIIVVELLFPFYWMVMTAIKPKDQLLDLDKHNPYYTLAPTFEHIHDLLFKTEYPLWLWNTMFIAVAATILSLIASVFAAYAITRIRYRGSQWVGGAIFLAYLVPPSILFIPLSTVVYQYGRFDTPFALNLTYPLLTPIIAVVMTFSVLFTFTDFQLIKVLTNGGPAGATELMATMSYNTAILGGRIGEGSAISTAMVPFLLAAIMVSWFGLQRRKWQAGSDSND